MNILKLALLFAATLKCVAGSGSDKTPNKLDQGKKVKQSSQVRGTVPTSSTVENNPDVFPSQTSSSGQLFPQPTYNIGWSGWGGWNSLQHVPVTANFYEYSIRNGRDLGDLQEARPKNETISSGGYPENSQHQVALSNTLFVCVKEGNYKRFNEMLAAMERHEERLQEKSGGQKNMMSSSRYKAVALGFCVNTFSEKDMQLKEFFISRGKELHSKYPIIYKYLYESLISQASFKNEDLREVRNLLGQPIPFSSKAIIDGLLVPFVGNFLDSDVQGFLDVAPRETIEEGILGPNKELGRTLWEKIVEGSFNVDPIFPPSTETLKNALERFPTKDELEEAWSNENAHRFKAKVLERVEETAKLISSLELLHKPLGKLAAEYAAPTRFSWIGPIQE